jgi:hypothetical protein
VPRNDNWDIIAESNDNISRFGELTPITQFADFLPHAREILKKLAKMLAGAWGR